MKLKQIVTLVRSANSCRHPAVLQFVSPSFPLMTLPHLKFSYFKGLPSGCRNGICFHEAIHYLKWPHSATFCASLLMPAFFQGLIWSCSFFIKKIYLSNEFLILKKYTYIIFLCVFSFVPVRKIHSTSIDIRDIRLDILNVADFSSQTTVHIICKRYLHKFTINISVKLSTRFHLPKTFNWITRYRNKNHSMIRYQHGAVKSVQCSTRLHIA